MFMMMNNNTTQHNTTQHNTTQQQERSQETKLREGINSEREEHSVKPQQRDHSIRLCWHKISNSSNVFSLSSKDVDFAPTTQFTLSTLEPIPKSPNYASQATDSN